MNKKHQRLLSLFKAIVAYKMTHNSDGIASRPTHNPKSFIFWTASDSFIWCKDAWVITIQEWPEFNTFRPYWTKDKLTNLWKKRLSQKFKEKMVKEAIKSLRKENKLVVNKRIETRREWRGTALVTVGTCVQWEYHWCDNALLALAALG